MKRYSGITILVAILLAVGCDRERGAESIGSVESAFERDVADIDSEMSRDVVYAYYELPKYGRERMEPDYQRATQILEVYHAFGKTVDSLKQCLQQSIEGDRTANYGVVKQKMGNNAGRQYVLLLVRSTIIKMLAITRLDSFEQVALLKEAEARYPYTFSDSMWQQNVHFCGSYSMARMELARLKADMVNATKRVVTRFVDFSNFLHPARFSDEIAFARLDNSYLFLGDEVDVSVYYGTHTNTDVMKVTRVEMQGKELTMEEGNGGLYGSYAHYKSEAKGRGLQQVFGRVEFMRMSDSEVDSRYVKAEYVVMDPIVGVKSKVPRFILTNFDNPLEFDLFSFPPNYLVVISDRGILKGGSGKYTLRVDEPGPVKLEIWAKRYNGKLRKMDSVLFMAVDELPK